MTKDKTVTWADKVQTKEVSKHLSPLSPCFSQRNKKVVKHCIRHIAAKQGIDLTINGRKSREKLSEHLLSDDCNHSRVDREIARRSHVNERWRSK